MSVKHDVALVAGLDGTVYLVDTKLRKIRWSFSSGQPIYSSYQANLESEEDVHDSNHNNASELISDLYYIDCGSDDWELYVHSKRFGKLRKLSLKVDEYIKQAPYISEMGEVTLGLKKTTAFIVDAKTGRVVRSYKVDSPSSTMEFRGGAGENAVMLVKDAEELMEPGAGDLRLFKNLVYITRTDYVLQHYSPNSSEVLWNVAFAEIEGEFRCQGMQNDFGDPANEIDDWQFPCQMRTTAIRIRDHSLLESDTLAIAHLGGGAHFLPVPENIAALGPVHRYPPALPASEDWSMLALPSSESRSLAIIDSLGRNTDTTDASSLSSDFMPKFHIWPLFACILAIAMGFFLAFRKLGKLDKPVENSKVQPVMPKKKKSRRSGNTRSSPNTGKKMLQVSTENKVGDANELLHGGGNERILSPAVTSFADVHLDGRRIGKLLVSNREIAKGSNGTVVLEGNYDGRLVAVKRLVKTHHDVALKEIQNLIASDQHPNIVRWYGVEHDEHFVYLALERCTCSLNDLIYVCSKSFQSEILSTDLNTNCLPEYAVRLHSILEHDTNVELWKANGHPSAQLLKLMRDVVSGLAHLHELGIIHRDLKPQNVLIIKGKTFYAKLSDMGISKRLVGDISGWQSPEQLMNRRQSRAVDLFSLGCVLFFCITGGKHPFGDSFERDVNIVNDRKDLFLVENIPEAVDLLMGLLDPIPDKRPKAQEVLHHPLFWSSEKRLLFLQEVSDRVELEDREKGSELLKALESTAAVALNGKWDEKMEAVFIKNIGQYRRYKYDSVRDLLRVIRNKSHHYRELPEEIKELLGSPPEGLESYFSCRFPKLLMEVYKVSSVGINYGTLGNNLPSPKRVAQLLQSTLIDKVKIYDTNPEILEAFSNTGIDLIVAVENYHVANISSDPSSADEWFATRVMPFLPATSIVAIAVGNEYLTTDPDHLKPNALFQAMQNLHAVLVARGLDRKIKITTPHSMAVLASSFPPSASTFATTLMPVLTSVVGFLADTGAPFMINAYPYFAYRDNPGEVDLEYALLGNASKGVHDPKGYVYTNMLDAQIDAVRSAIGALGFENRTVKITVSESGWPSKGEPGDTAATPDNAKTYNTRLIERAQSGRGTPMRAKDDVEIFVFALFNENKKEGGVSERNFGIFNGDGSKVYEVDLSCKFCSSSSSSGDEGSTSFGFGEQKMGTRGPSVWCVAKPHADEKVLQAVLDFCCGPGGVDCREIYESGDCFAPDKLHAHASYAMNAYYQMHGRNYWNCDFKATGLVTFSDPNTLNSKSDVKVSVAPREEQRL
ncbi:hypothetical protein Tsubulata_035021 [Turnera subulata]|uniref:(1->3)-beta-glucan endohydrolase n=1 Tax=Turnera subulata TaxID=218843 RepID=A0A9Q0F7A1_9ROSI|nr:hypothetical protein Tsubulata_035021 [Turnera subulata]